MVILTCAWYLHRLVATALENSKQRTNTDWGQKIHNGQAGDPAGWVGGVAAGQFIMRNEGWREWTDKWGSRVTSRKTFYQQYSCHVLGGSSNWAGDWNLEASAGTMHGGRPMSHSIGATGDDAR